MWKVTLKVTEGNNGVGVTGLAVPIILLNQISATRHQLRQWAISNTTDNVVLLDIVEEDDEDNHVPATMKEAYLNR
jgi:hypothetical protein